MNATRRAAIIAAPLAVLAVSACGGGAAGDDNTLTFAPQFGLPYLPDTIINSEGYLDDALPDMKVKSVQLSSGGAVTEQILSGSVDVGYMGTGPFLKSVDSGADLKAIGCVAQMPLDLMVSDSSQKDISDLTTSDRIALPGPSSHQSYTLAVAADRELGDPEEFDEQLVSLPHPDAMSAFLSKQDVSAHFTQPPFTGMEEADGAHSILNSFDVFGPHCLIVAVGRADLQETDPDIVEGVRTSLQKSLTFINRDPQAAADALREAGDDTPRARLLADITAPDAKWTVDITGLESVSDAMREAGVLESDHDASDLVFDGTEAS